MRTLDGLHVEVEGSRFWMCANSGIAGICERARLAITKTCDIVFVATEVLLFRGLQLELFANQYVYLLGFFKSQKGKFLRSLLSNAT